MAPADRDDRANLTARPYRELSVQRHKNPDDLDALLDWVSAREFYRRTRYLLAHRSERAALLELTLGAPTGLFAPVRKARVLADPDQLLWVRSPETDVGNASALCEVALRHRRPDISAFVVTGRYEHVNFLLDPAPVVIYVDEVVPPDRPKLVEMVRQAVAFDEGLPPVQVVSRLISLPMLRRHQPGRALLPCTGAGTDEDDVDYLDDGPNARSDWTLVGCTRSQEIFTHHYQVAPRAVRDICPERLGRAGPAAGLGLARVTKCCLLERGVRAAGGTATVPWGASLDEVRQAVRAVVCR